MSDGSSDTPRRPAGVGRVPPHNLDAEASLLGAMLLSASAVASAIEVVSRDDFYKPAYGHIFEAITSLYGSGEPIDPVTVAEELRRANLLDAIGGSSVLVDLQATTPAISNAGGYAHIVEEHALLRRLIGVAGEIAELGYSLPDDVTKAVDRAEAMVYDVAQRRVADTIAPVHDLLESSLSRLEQLYDRGESITGLATGYNDLDELLSGLQPSSLVVVGRSTEHGQVRRVGHADPRSAHWRRAHRGRGASARLGWARGGGRIPDCGRVSGGGRSRGVRRRRHQAGVPRRARDQVARCARRSRIRS